MGVSYRFRGAVSIQIFRFFSPFTVWSVDVRLVGVGLIHQSLQFIHASLAAAVAVHAKFTAKKHQHGGGLVAVEADAGTVGVGGRGRVGCRGGHGGQSNR